MEVPGGGGKKRRVGLRGHWAKRVRMSANSNLFRRPTQQVCVCARACVLM
jgi:hypothetical protein